MWICLNNGFLNCVADPRDPSRLIVRVRRKIDLVRVFGRDVEIVETPRSDYRWSIFMDRKQFKEVMNAKIDAINDVDLADSVTDRDLHRMYQRFWMEHFEYGEAIPRNRNAELAYGADGGIRHPVKTKKT